MQPNKQRVAVMGFAEVFVVAAAESVGNDNMKGTVSPPWRGHSAGCPHTALPGLVLRQSAPSTATSSKGMFIQLVTAVPEWYRGG